MLKLRVLVEESERYRKILSTSYLMPRTIQRRERER